MSGSQTPFARRSLSGLSRIAPDRRRHQRRAVTPLGRFLRANKPQVPCRLVDAIGVGARVAAYVDQEGGTDGPVAHTIDGGFACETKATPHKREQIAAQLTWPANRAELANASERRHERVAPSNTVSELALAEGVVACKMLEVSSSAACVETCVETPARPQLGTEVMLGKLRAPLMRHHAQRFGLQFIEIRTRLLRRYFGSPWRAPWEATGTGERTNR
jgi:hypothetical protein